MSSNAGSGLADLSLESAAAALAAGECTSVELTEAVLQRIEEVDGRYRAFITVDSEGAIEQARAADHRRHQGDVSPLTGVPVAVKDNIVTRGLRTTCASKLLKDFVPPYDATVVTALREAGAVIVGKTNLDEFAMGSSTENSGLFVTRNPWDRSRVPGGSSGGSATAVVFGGCNAALGSDTGGSIRQPASFCGVVGCKPTYGRVSRWGLVAMASSLDQIGPLTKTVRDNAILLGAIAGHEARDSTSSRRPVADYLQGIENGVSGLTLGVAPELAEVEGMHPGVAEVSAAARATLESLGARFVDVELPHLKYSISSYYIICPSEVSANMARFDGIRYGDRQQGENMWDSYCKTRGRGLGSEVIRRVMLGAFALSAGYYDAYYKKAAQVRTLIAGDFERALEKCDALLMPVTPSPAFRIGELVDDPLQLYLADVFTVSLNLAGLPGVCFPAGTVDGLPQGVQVVGRPFAEDVLFRVARAFERETAWSLTDRLAAHGGELA